MEIQMGKKLVYFIPLKRKTIYIKKKGEWEVSVWILGLCYWRWPGEHPRTGLSALPFKIPAGLALS